MSEVEGRSVTMKKTEEWRETENGLRKEIVLEKNLKKEKARVK